MKYRIAICDDDVDFAAVLEKIVTQHLIMSEYDYEICSFSDENEMLAAGKSGKEFQIYFLDVEMMPLDGIKLAKKIRQEINRYAYIIFVSNYPEYMAQSFEAHPYHYIQKPCKREVVIHLLNEIFAEISSKLAICNLELLDGTQEKIFIKDILYLCVEDARRGLLAIQAGCDKLIIRGTVNEWENKLKEYNFTICYKGILVNLLHIHYFAGNKIIMDNGEELPLSRINEKRIKKLYIGKIIEMY